MSKAKMILHCGARQVEREELDTIQAPPCTATWYPVKHSVVYDTVHNALAASGFLVKRAQFALSRNDARMFATVDIVSEFLAGITLAVGIRNSVDQSFPLGFCAGNRTVVCDNLLFTSDILVAKKHTRFGQARFEGEISQAVKTLSSFQKHECERVLALQQHKISDEFAESLMLRAFESKLVSHRVLPTVISEWRKPSYDEFEPRSAWSLLSAFTTALGPKAKTNAQEYSRVTMRVGGLIDNAVGIQSF